MTQSREKCILHRATVQLCKSDLTSLLEDTESIFIRASFAQLGCLRLHAECGIVILIANVRQDILAKATRTLSLLLADTDDSGDDDDELWFEMRLL